MKKNYKKYGTTGLLWALYLIVGAVAFLVSDFYFKFALKDAIIFGAVNLVVVVLITEGIDLIFKKVRLRQERRNAENQSSEEFSSEESVVPVVEEQTDKATEPEETPVRTDEELSFKETLGTKESPADDDEAPMLITGRPGLGHKGYQMKAYLGDLKKAESADSEAKETSGDTDVAETTVESPISEESLTERTAETITEPVADNSSKPRGRRANPGAIIDAPTSSIPVITPDMIKPRVEAVAEPVAEPVVEETYLSADEFLSTTKLTSPRAIVREYQRLGGKDDIFNILMERQK